MISASTDREALYPIGSVGKALALLGLLNDRKTLRVMDVSRKLEIAPSTAHRLLAMFEQYGFLSQAERHAAYTIGPALVEIATSIAGRLDIETALHPQLIGVSREFNETALLCVLRGDQALYLDAVESTHGLRAVSRNGRSLPAHATAGGKALLAELSDLDFRRRYPNEELETLTPRTYGSRTALMHELGRIRERGYAVNSGESELHFAACAAVVRDRAGFARASIVLAGPASRFRRYESGRIAGAVRAAASDASSSLTLT